MLKNNYQLSSFYNKNKIRIRDEFYGNEDKIKNNEDI